MSPEQIKIVKRTWRKLMMVDPILVADLFYTKLFTEYPKIRGLFPRDMTAQNKKLTDMLTYIITSIDHVESLQKEITDMAERHVGYKVKTEHYQWVGQALIWTLEKGLAGEWNEEVKAAWLACYNTLASHMLKTVH